MLTDEEAVRLRACLRASHGFRETLPSGYPAIAELLLAQHAEIARLRGYVEANKRNDAMVCERWADERCGECPGCLAAREDSKPGPHEQRVLDGLDPREDYTDGERELIRGRLREAQEHDAQEAGARRGLSQPLEEENARLHAKVERLRKTKGELAQQVANMAVRNTDLTLEVERLRKAVVRIANGLRESGRDRADLAPSRETFADMLDALAREDGAP